MKRNVPHYARGLPFRLGDDATNATAHEPHVIPADELRAMADRGVARVTLGALLWSTPGHTEEGAQWLQAAAQAGNAEAMHVLGLAYFRGQGVAKDLARARALQADAAERGFVDAQFELSLLLAQGIGGKRDVRGARRWEDAAADAGHPRACLNRGARLAKKKPPGMAAAVGWYQRAADAGNAEAAARLCRMHLAGRGAARDEAAAKRWYERAAELGYDWSAERHG